MIGALWTGISGLASHQSALDNESHNIANVNTIGYKASRISFADQMYQDRIGKGSKVLYAEKLYVQGTLKPTGVDYDMGLTGDGFFTVLNTRSSGTAETLYTRAGNFRMGDNGTLQDPAGNEVQGWAMREIDIDKDVVSTNPNVHRFTSDYTKPLVSKIIKHSNYVETITTKATDYQKSAKGDSSTIFSGAGKKSKSAKINDVEELVKSYRTYLQKLKDTPDGGSASSTAQISQINFKSYDQLAPAGRTDNGLISKEGDQIYVYINGNRYSQNYISLTTTEDLDGSGGAADDTDNKIASRIATYKALADKISEIPGLRAYMVNEPVGGINDTLESGENYTLSTSNADMIKGIIQIESLIPGESFNITEVGEVSDSNTLAGQFQTSTAAIMGEGVGALESAREALAKAISGKQQDVYTLADLGLAADGSVNKNFTYGITIYDKELKKNIPVPGDNTTVPATAMTLSLNAMTSVDDIVTAINTSNIAGSSFQLPDYVVAKNINGNLVIETKNSNFDVEFSGGMKVDDGAGTFEPLDKNNDYSGRQGAGAEFIELVNTIDQTTTQSSLQLKLDTLGISDSAFGAFSVDSAGLITMKQDGAEFALGQVSIALFNSNRGLNPVGDNLLAKTNDSGEPIYNLNNDKTAKIEGKTLELSKADLSESLVNLMVFQRAFEANAKSITTSDQLLNTLINLKR